MLPDEGYSGGMVIGKGKSKKMGENPARITSYTTSLTWNRQELKQRSRGQKAAPELQTYNRGKRFNFPKALMRKFVK